LNFVACCRADRFTRAEDRKRALLGGFQIHVTKPADPNELVLALATLVGRTEADRQ
jgi:CheY-like chemotaxis protein